MSNGNGKTTTVCVRVPTRVMLNSLKKSDSNITRDYSVDQVINSLAKIVRELDVIMTSLPKDQRRALGQKMTGKLGSVEMDVYRKVIKG